VHHAFRPFSLPSPEFRASTATVHYVSHLVDTTIHNKQLIVGSSRQLFQESLIISRFCFMVCDIGVNVIPWIA
jgi:hypothetical protein